MRSYTSKTLTENEIYSNKLIICYRTFTSKTIVSFQIRLLSLINFTLNGLQLDAPEKSLEKEIAIQHVSGPGYCESSESWHYVEYGGIGYEF